MPRLLACAGFAILDGASSDDPPRAYIEEFRAFAVPVVDAEGRPAQGLGSTARVERKGAVLAQEQEPYPASEGRYPSPPTAIAFYDDGRHVVKRSGPEQVLAAPVRD